MLRRELEYRYGEEGTKQFIEVLLLFDKYPRNHVREAVAICCKREHFSLDAIRGHLEYRAPCSPRVLDLSGRPDLVKVHTVARSPRIYDALEGSTLRRAGGEG
jgi:hypothetical protein